MSSKRPAEEISKSESASQGIKPLKRKIISTLDPIEAERYQLFTKVEVEGGIIYTSWNIFSGIEYFEKLLDSSMKESKSREVKFTYMNLVSGRDYLDLISSLHIEDFTWNKDLLSLYDQLDYHQLIKYRDICKNKILHLPYSTKLYKWNKVRGVLSLNIIASKLHNHIHDSLKTGEKIEFPLDDDQLLTKFLVQCSSKINGQLSAWTILRGLSYHKMTKFIEYYKMVPSLSISAITFHLMCMERDNTLINHRDLFIKHISYISYNYEIQHKK